MHLKSCTQLLHFALLEWNFEERRTHDPDGTFKFASVTNWRGKKTKKKKPTTTLWRSRGALMTFKADFCYAMASLEVPSGRDVVIPARRPKESRRDNSKLTVGSSRMSSSGSWSSATAREALRCCPPDMFLMALLLENLKLQKCGKHEWVHLAHTQKLCFQCYFSNYVV